MKWVISRYKSDTFNCHFTPKYVMLIWFIVVQDQWNIPGCIRISAWRQFHEQFSWDEKKHMTMVTSYVTISFMTLATMMTQQNYSLLVICSYKQQPAYCATNTNSKVTGLTGLSTWVIKMSSAEICQESSGGEEKAFVYNKLNNPQNACSG